MPDRRSVVVLFDGTYEGFLCVVYAFYYEGIMPLSIELRSNYQQSFDSEVYYADTDYDRALRVQQGIQEKISDSALDYIVRASLHGDNDKYMDMFKYLLLGFKVGADVDAHMQQDYVMKVHKLARMVGRESHKLIGFCRFAKTHSGVFYCVITPSHDVLNFLAEHFCQRMMGQPWVIHDKTRRQAAVYDGSAYTVVAVENDVEVQYSDDEAEVQDLWVNFFNTLAIKERTNPRCQRNMLPMYFRKNMVEFKQI